MEEILARHRKEQRDLQAQVTQKKKGASKKTRKAVNDECARLEEDQKLRHSKELAEVDVSTNGSAPREKENTGNTNAANDNDDDDLLASIVHNSLHVNNSSTSKGLDSGSSPMNGDDDTEENAQATPSSRKPNRQKARMARRAAEHQAVVEQAKVEAANMPDKKRDERKRMLDEFERRKLTEKVVPATGHCMYLAVADQLKLLEINMEPSTNSDHATNEDQATGEKGGVPEYKIVRQSAASFIAQHPDDFIPFMEEPLEEYVHKVRDTAEWGGHLELLALAKVYGVNINVLQDFGRVEVVQGSASQDAAEAWLAYYKHGFGLGEHYNSLRTDSGKTT